MRNAARIFAVAALLFTACRPSAAPSRRLGAIEVSTIADEATIHWNNTSKTVGVKAASIADAQLAAANVATTTSTPNAIPKAGSGGQLNISWLATGTPDGTKFVRDDGALAVPPGAGDMVLASVQTVTGAKTFGSAGAVGKLKIAGSTSGSTVLDATAAAGSGTVTLPTTGTLATLAGSETLLSKTLTAPTIADFTNATHNHQGTSAGGTLDGVAIASGTVANARLTSGTTSTAGILQLTDSVASTSTTTAATPNAVKTAYDLANSNVATFTTSTTSWYPRVLLDTSSNDGPTFSNQVRWSYVGYFPVATTISAVWFYIPSVPCVTFNSGEVAAASSHDGKGPDGTNKTLDKIGATAITATLTSSGVKKQTVSWTIPAGSHVWDGARIDCTTTPRIQKVNEFDQYSLGDVLQTTSVTALTGSSSWTGTANSTYSTPGFVLIH